MFSLFRSKNKHLSSRGRASKQLAPRPRIESGQSDPPSLVGYAVQELDVSQFARSVQTARLTPEQLRALAARIK
jgi:hypothetical protein